MADAPPSPQETPKRKRGVDTAIAPIVFSFDPNRSVEDGSNSPRSKVAHKFRGLALAGEDASGGGVVDGVHGEDGGIGGLDGSDDSVRRKRQRPDEDMPDAFESKADDDLATLKGKSAPHPEVAHESESTTESSSGSLQRAYPSINRLSESKPRGRKKRAGTPPPRSRRKKTADASEEDIGGEDEVIDIVDAVRAALTWQEDEITIYDPNDEDDDGTGINGVGFRPTPALAHARLIRRRQQMAEYKKREESDARARRSQRRRGQDPSSSSQDKDPDQRKVRFMAETADDGVRFSAVKCD